MSAAIRLDNLTLGYDRHPAVHHLSGQFAHGSLTAIVGPNGAGKSTLLKGVKGLLPVLSGRVVLGGLTREHIAYLPQQAELETDFPISVLDVVLLGHWHRVGRWRAMNADLRAQAVRALDAVGLGGVEHRSLAALSIGQRQRVLFARVLLQDAPVILLDEPFAAVDARTTADLLAVVKSWHAQGRTVVAVLHDHDQVRAHFPETLLLAGEAVAWGATAGVMVPSNMERLARPPAAFDEAAPVCRRGAGA